MRGLVSKLGAAAAIAMGAAFNDFGGVPVIRKGLHRSTADSKAGRQLVSRKYRSSNKYARTFNSQYECDRRKLQLWLADGKPTEFYTQARMDRLYGPERYVRPAKAWPPRA